MHRLIRRIQSNMALFRNSALLLTALFIAAWEGPAIVISTKPSLGTLREPHDGIHLEKTVVWIYNNLGPALDLTIHCKFKKDDLGTHVILYQSNYQWSFHVNFWETTLFFCGLSWQEGSGVFDIFVAMRDEYRCPYQCNWIACTDGMHGLKEGTQRDPDIVYTWEKPPKLCPSIFMKTEKLHMLTQGQIFLYWMQLYICNQGQVKNNIHGLGSFDLKVLQIELNLAFLFSLFSFKFS